MIRYPNNNQPQVGSLAGIGSLGYGSSSPAAPAQAPYHMSTLMGAPAVAAPQVTFNQGSPMTPAAAPQNNLLAPSIGTFGQGDALFDAMSNTGGFNPNAAGNGLAPVGGGDQQGWLQSTLFDKNGGLNVGNITGLLGSIASIYGGFKQLGLAKDSLNFSKEAFRTNIDNQKKSYNTALEDRARSRYAQEGAGDGAADDYVRKNRL